jgi:hypothetical protein
MIWVVHPGPGSRIRILIFTYPGSRIQGSKRHRILNTALHMPTLPMYYKGTVVFPSGEKTLSVVQESLAKG